MGTEEGAVVTDKDVKDAKATSSNKKNKMINALRRRSLKTATTTNQLDREAAENGTGESFSSSTPSRSTPTSPQPPRSTRKDTDGLRRSADLRGRMGGSDIVRSNNDLLGRDLLTLSDEDREGEIEDYETVLIENRIHGLLHKSSGKATSAPDLSRARKVEMVVSKLYELGNSAPHKKKKNFLQRLGLLVDEQQQMQDELKLKQLNDEIQSLSQELALSPRGNHSSPVLSLKAMKLLGMVDSATPVRWTGDDNQRENEDDDLPAHTTMVNAAVPLKAMKTLGVMDGASTGSYGSKKARGSAILRSSASSTPLSDDDDDEGCGSNSLSPLAMLLDWKGRRARANSKEIILPDDSLTSSSSSTASSDSEAGLLSVRSRRARTLSKEELSDISLHDRDAIERRERRARTLSKGI